MLVLIVPVWTIESYMSLLFSNIQTLNVSGDLFKDSFIRRDNPISRLSSESEVKIEFTTIFDSMFVSNGISFVQEDSVINN